ncbi:MAG: NDP-sugar synthase [Acidobacteriota bacterium]
MSHASPHLRALVLSAGYGTRLQPLTWTLPKPLLPIAGETVVGETLGQLGRAGCGMAILNLHHCGAEIPRHLGRRHRGLDLEYVEEEEIQGTFGALWQPRDLLRAADVVILVNGDSLCRWPLRRLVKRHLSAAADATLMLLDRQPDEKLGGGVGVDATGRIVSLRDASIGEPAQRRIFAGLHLLSPHLLDRAEPGFADIVEALYIPLMEEGAMLRGEVTPGVRWHDLGTPQRYHAAILDWLQTDGQPPLGRLRARLRGRRDSYVSPLALLDPQEDLQIVRSSVQRSSRLGTGVRLEDSLVCEGATIGAGARIAGSIIGPGVEISESSEIAHRLVTKADPSRPLPDGASSIGDLLYVPLR